MRWRASAADRRRLTPPRSGWAGYESWPGYELRPAGPLSPVR